MRRLLVLSLIAFASSAAGALTVPFVLTQQGRLLDGNDQPVNGEKHVTFELYDTDNANTHLAVWHEEQDVTFSDGRYAVVLGDTSEGHAGTAIGDDVLGKATLYLSTTIDGAELLPRLRVTSAPYALRAGRAAEAELVLDGGVATNALVDQAVTTPKLADGSITLAKLALTDGKFVGLDADTLDGLDSSAFAPSSLVDTIGQPPEGSSIAGELASIRATAEAGATSSALATVDAKVGQLSSDVANDTTNLGGAVDAVGAKVDATSGKVDATSGKVDGVASQVTGVASQLSAEGGKVDAVTTKVGGLDAKLGAPASGSVAGDLAALKAELDAWKTVAQREYSRTCQPAVDGWVLATYGSEDACLHDGRWHEVFRTQTGVAQYGQATDVRDAVGNGASVRVTVDQNTTSWPKSIQCDNISMPTNSGNDIQCGAQRRDDLPLTDGPVNSEWIVYDTLGHITWVYPGQESSPNNYSGIPGWTMRWWVKY